MTSLTNDQTYQYSKWLSTNTAEPVEPDALHDQVLSELHFAKSMTSEEYTLWRTWLQVNDEFDANDKSVMRHIRKTKNKIYIPDGPEDIETLEPELVFVQQEFPVPRVSIWGSERIAFMNNPDALSEDWENMRHFVSSMEHGGNVGRSVRFIVRDKSTKKNLGIICIAGDFGQLKGRDDAIGWMNPPPTNGLPDRLNNTAIGSVLVPTQPLGYSFLGGKLMALLATSKPVSDMWERLYGDVLAGVTTTSLYGAGSVGTQYDGMKPYWKRCGESPGDTGLRPKIKTMRTMKDWMKFNHPQQFWELYIAKRENGQPLRRSANERAREFCYKQLGIDTSDFRSGHPRGIYFSRLYENTDAFLCGKIEASDLKSRERSHSVEALTDYWRKMARKRAASLSKNDKFSRDTHFMDDLVGTTWEEAKAKYLR